VETVTSKIEFIRKVFGNVIVARDGVNVAARCPKCGKSDKKKFSINLENWACHCWVCGIKGKDPYRIILHHIDEGFAQEFKIRFSFQKNSFENKVLESDVAERVVLPENIVPLFGENVLRDPDIRNCLSYLKMRGVTPEDIWYFKLCSSTSGKFRRRIIIPSFDFEGELNYFSARAIDSNVFLKYINSKAKKKDIIFNEINIDWSQEIALTEGPFDLFKCNQNATCLLGSKLSRNSYLFKKIVSNKTPVLLALDGDMRKDARKIADLLEKYNIDVRMIDLGKFQDVGEMNKKDFQIAREKASAWSREISLREKIASIQTGSLI